MLEFVKGADIKYLRDIDIQEKESGTFKAIPPAMGGSGHSASNSYTVSIAQMLEFVKGAA